VTRLKVRGRLSLRVSDGRKKREVEELASHPKLSASWRK
jgi:hypothetical protein